MDYRKKFHIRHLKPEMSFEETLKPILHHHFRRIKKRAKKYQINPTREKLHDLRIAIRRFRYNLEPYVFCFKPKKFNQLYENLVQLQNLLGERRDIDVMEEKITKIYKENQEEIPQFLQAQWNSEKRNLDSQITERLKTFLKDIAVRN